MRRLRGGIWDAPDNLYTEEQLNKLGLKLKINAKAKYLAWNGKDHIKVYDVIDTVPKDTRAEERARRNRAKSKKFFSCLECGKKEAIKEDVEEEAKHCDECLKEHQKISKKFLEKIVKDKDIYIKLENVHRNRALMNNLKENKEKTLDYLRKNKKLKLEVSEATESKELYIKIYAGKFLVGYLPAEILIKEYKTLPNIVVTKERIASMIQKGFFKIEVQLARLKQKKSFQERVSYDLEIKLTSKNKTKERELV